MLNSGVNVKTVYKKKDEGGSGLSFTPTSLNAPDAKRVAKKIEKLLLTQKPKSRKICVCGDPHCTIGPMTREMNT